MTDTNIYASCNWDYNQQDEWPLITRRKLQSPIELFEDEAIPRHYMPLEFNNYNKEYFALLTNVGFSVQVNPIIEHKDTPPSISGGGLFHEYFLHSFHFHWSAEHKINGHQYPLEAHFIHYAKKYGSLVEAVNYKDGILKVASFSEFSPKDNEAFGPLIEAMPEIRYKIHQEVPLENPIRLNHFIPKKIEKFYRYQGSITKPKCNEAVIWTILQTPTYISHSQFNELTNIFNTEGRQVTTNCRNSQPLNERRVYISKI